MAFLLINPADTARKLFVLGDPLRVTHDPAAGGAATLTAYVRPATLTAFVRPATTTAYIRP